ncbi:bifunctional riboflavin kinase/FAD synthetase [Flavobacteriaceae bacterium]|nr:bifunctional riboflavin kinase/FAD synthetase [Flavobacteriaceae bacterium]MDC1491984.1 bifunctional riboflavin kinase/FAD synthetase [Flavobacteriaceae bacterium]MDC1534929.1 bifunctional riboflavin kinase/FAD synthetase [Flavobacteriaceae bacterium]
MIRENLKDYNSIKPSVITIGTFDGVHIGHKKIINQLTTISSKSNLTSILLSFFPHPKMVLQNDKEIKLINTIQEKEGLLNSLHLDYLIIKEFTKEFSRLSALEFVRDILVNKLNARHIIIGYDHHFGRNRTANIEQLKEFGELYDFKVTEILAQDIDDIAISSTKIRDALINGEIELANKYLGYNFFFNGNVIHGNNIGNTISFPTANIEVDEPYKLVPKNGVYIVKTIIDNQITFGMMNIGFNPTFNGKHKSIEIHFLNFNKNIYHKNLTIEMISRIRNEEKFNSVEDLKKQLEADKVSTLSYIKSLNI